MQPDPFDSLNERLDALKRKCGTGYGCGSTCISVKKECRGVPSASTGKERLRRLSQLARGEITPRGIGNLKPDEAKAKAKALQQQRSEQQAVIRAERERRRAEAARTGKRPSVVVKLRRAKPGGEYGPDGHWYPGGSWMSEGEFVGAKPVKTGAGLQPDGGKGKEGGSTEPRVIQPKEKPRRIQPTEPKGEGLPRPTGLKKTAQLNDEEFFNDRGYIRENLKYGDGSLGGYLFQAAVAQRMTTEELNWATDQIVRITGADRASLAYNLETDTKVYGGDKEALDYYRSFSRNQLIGVDDERLKAAVIFMEASRELGYSSPAQQRLRQRKKEWDDGGSRPPQRQPRRQPGGKVESAYGDWIWGLNNVFRAVRIRRGR